MNASLQTEKIPFVCLLRAQESEQHLAEENQFQEKTKEATSKTFLNFKSQRKYDQIKCQYTKIKAPNEKLVFLILHD